MAAPDSSGAAFHLGVTIRVNAPIKILTDSCAGLVKRPSRAAEVDGIAVARVSDR
jgi:hypothetical protein